MHGSESFILVIDSGPTHSLIFHSRTLVLPLTTRGCSRGDLHCTCRDLHGSSLLAKDNRAQFTAHSCLNLSTVASFARRSTLHSTLHAKVPDLWPRYSSVPHLSIPRKCQRAYMLSIIQSRRPRILNYLCLFVQLAAPGALKRP